LLQIAVSSVLAPLSIYFTQRIIDVSAGIIAGRGDWNGLILWMGLLATAMFFSSLGGGFLNGILYIAIRRRLNTGMTPAILRKFRRLDYACFEDESVRDTLERMSSEPQYKLFDLFLNILGVAECCVGVVAAAMIYAQAGWLFVAGFAALLFPMIWLDFKSADMINTMINNQSADERMMHYLGGLLSEKSSLFELKIFRAAGYVADKWRGVSREVLDTRVKTTVDAQKYYLISTVLFKCWSFFVILGLVGVVVRGDITIGLFTALIASSGAMLDNASMLSHSMQNLRQRYRMTEHFERFMGLPEHAGNEQTDASGFFDMANAGIVFENVSFAYPGTGKQILRDVSFAIEPGERAAIVGVNGAGKSTIVKLLCRLYEPDGGRIMVGKSELRELDAAALRKLCSVVFQDFCKYSLTLRENVAFGDLSKREDDAALCAALEMGMADGVAALDAPLGRLEDDGTDLSGGQWQRIAVARACLPDSAFIVLDEPTASMDPLAESRMYNGFAAVLRQRGAIMISHRLASAKMADKIIVLEGGVVAETGSHDELIALGGLYARMYASQAAWYLPGAEGSVPEGGEPA